MANVRNDMYLTSEAIRLIEKNRLVAFNADTRSQVQLFKTQLDDATRYIPLWVKVAVAIALGLGTMVGWRRIVVTVGEKIGKTHLSYAKVPRRRSLPCAPLAQRTCSGCRFRPPMC